MKLNILSICFVSISLLLTHFSHGLLESEMIGYTKIKTQPLQVKVMSFVAGQDDLNLESLPAPKAPSVQLSTVLWDPKEMPHPDPTKKMFDGPDRTFVPPVKSEPEIFPGPTHTTTRNMVVPGDSMITIEDSSNINQSQSNNVLERLESLDLSDMPRTPILEQGAECSDEASVLRVGQPVVIAHSIVIPTKDTFGTGPEVNSYQDFSSGIPIEQHVTESDISSKKFEVTQKTADAALNYLPPIPELISEDYVDMAFKFSGKVRFFCKDDLSASLDSKYGLFFREGAAIGAQVPTGNVAINQVTKDSIVYFDVGARTIADVRTEVATLRSYIKNNELIRRMQLRGFPIGCQITIISIGDGVEEDGLMPEPTQQQQTGSPGGEDETPLTPKEQRDRIIVREAMTYGEYTKPGKYNVTVLSPHLFKNGVMSKSKHFYVVGRFKFLVENQNNRETFAAMYSNTIIKTLSKSVGVSPSQIILSVNGKPQPQFSSGTQSFLQTSRSDTDGVIVDFEISTTSLKDARRIVSELTDSLGDSQAGFGFLLRAASPSLIPVEFTLLFVEIHGFDGMTILDDEDENCDDEEEEDLSVPTKQITLRDMNTVPDCNQTKLYSIKNTDPSTVQVKPANSPDDWKVMTKVLAEEANTMNLPGRSEAHSLIPVQSILQISSSSPKHSVNSKLKPKTHHNFDAGLGVSNLRQVAVELRHDVPKLKTMKDKIAQELLVPNAPKKEVSEKSTDMPEPI